MTARKVQFYVVKMDEVWTLRQVCRITGVTIRSIQGYEKAGLVHPIGHNERGYLLYNAEGIQRIQKIIIEEEILEKKRILKRMDEMME